LGDVKKSRRKGSTKGGTQTVALLRSQTSFERDELQIDEKRQAGPIGWEMERRTEKGAVRRDNTGLKEGKKRGTTWGGATKRPSEGGLVDKKGRS